MIKNNFFAGFVEQIKEKKVGSVVLEYFTKHSHFDGFVFVEGISDIGFYSHVLNDKLKHEKISYISCGGKNNLIKSLNYFERNNLLFGKENYHIVDKDYTGIMMYNPEFPEKLTVTKYYSYENYVFEDENFNKLLNECSFTENDINTINALLKEFIIKIIDFETIISMNANNEICVKLSSKDFDENVKFDCNNQVIINEYFDEGLNEIINSLSKRKKKLFRRRKEELLSNFLNIRGHDLEFFFDNILGLYNKKYKLIDFMSKEEFLAKIKVDLELK